MSFLKKRSADSFRVKPEGEEASERPNSVTTKGGIVRIGYGSTSKCFAPRLDWTISDLRDLAVDKFRVPHSIRPLLSLFCEEAGILCELDESGPVSVGLEKMGIGAHQQLHLRINCCLRWPVDMLPEAQLKFLYHKCRHDFVRGMLGCSKRDGLELAALTLQLECGNATEAKSVPVPVSELLPAAWAGESLRSIWSEWERLNSLKSLACLRQFVNTCMQWPLYGSVIVPGTDMRGEARDVRFIAVGHDGVRLLKKEFNIIKHFKYSEVPRWSCGEISFVFIGLDHSDPQTYEMHIRKEHSGPLSLTFNRYSSISLFETHSTALSPPDKAPKRRSRRRSSIQDTVVKELC